MKRAARKVLFESGRDAIVQLRQEFQLVSEEFERRTKDVNDASDPQEKLRLSKRLLELNVVHEKLRDKVWFVDWLLETAALSEEDVDRLPNQFRQLLDGIELYEIGESGDVNNLILSLEPICGENSLNSLNPDLYGREILYGERLTKILKYSPSLAHYRERCMRGELRFAMNAPITKERLKSRLLDEGASAIRANRDEFLRLKLKQKELTARLEDVQEDVERLALSEEREALLTKIASIEDRENINDWIMYHNNLTLFDIENHESQARYQKSLLQRYKEEITQLKGEIERLKKEAELDAKCEVLCETLNELISKGLESNKAILRRLECLRKSMAANQQLVAKLLSRLGSVYTSSPRSAGSGFNFARWADHRINCKTCCYRGGWANYWSIGDGQSTAGN